MSSFTKATKEKSKVRLAIMGPAGSGKTFGALTFAQALGKKIAVIDSERGSAAKYADLFEFDTCDLDNHDPRTYTKLIKEAEKEYDVLIIDSLSHAWSGKDGALEQVDKAAKRSQSGNSFSAWRDVTPMHNELVDAIVGAQCHIIATLRTKQEYVLEENAKGKKVPRKVGMAPIQRDGVEYEFDVLADVNIEHDLIVSKTRCPDLDGYVKNKPGIEFGETLAAWVNSGAPAKKKASPPAKDSTSTTGGAKDVGEQTATPSTPADDAVPKEMLVQLGTVAEQNGWSKKALTAFCVHAFNLDPKNFKLTEKQWKTTVGIVQQEKNKDGKVLVSSTGKDLAEKDQWEYKA